MKIMAVVAVVVCSLMHATWAEAGAKKVRKLDVLNAKVVGKKLLHETGHVTLLSTGKVKGRLVKKKVSGTWVWKGRKVCTDLIWGGERTGAACRTVAIDGDTVYFIRSNGKQTQYTIKN